MTLSIFVGGVHTRRDLIEDDDSIFLDDLMPGDVNLDNEGTGTELRTYLHTGVPFVWDACRRCFYCVPLLPVCWASDKMSLSVSASAVGLDGAPSWSVTPERRPKFVTPRALVTDEIPLDVDDNKRAAKSANEACGLTEHAGAA
ncbi:hypothetical protein PF006_g24863 [Phytophthora fragariae]|uniref:Uncharacterized protein n=1 Tax=Phytophthora fragariae TaxID=53985 RepID=A0A6A3R805_9STRA|nr:hypothetical protein PF003_g1978 [Phytophthora fragariae]KAE9091735.1 hypothetical protein PF006_g24863 [Phytophthora fragariae]